MKKTILFISSMDTKQEEIHLAADIARADNCNTLIMDTSTKTIIPGAGDISPSQVLAHNQITWDEFENMDKGLRIETMAKAVVSYTLELYRQKKFDGVMSIGGGQNSKMSADAMKELPYGVPKLLVSTLASGNRIFDTYMGNKDILVMHSVIDIAGINSLSKMIITNAVSAMVGMLEHGAALPTVREKKRVAATMLGITTKGTAAVMTKLERMGYETIAFHANGVGGGSMEQLMDEDYFDLILDMTLHEITCELYGGFCSGTHKRLLKGAQTGVPQIIVPGAIDVLDFAVTPETREHILQKAGGRQYYFQNSGILHAKINTCEAVELAKVIAERLNQATGPIELILPLNGFCEAGAKGRELCNKEVDETFLKVLKENLLPDIHITEVDANINDPVFADVVIQKAKKIMRSE